MVIVITDEPIVLVTAAGVAGTVAVIPVVVATTVVVVLAVVMLAVVVVRVLVGLRAILSLPHAASSKVKTNKNKLLSFTRNITLPFLLFDTLNAQAF